MFEGGALSDEIFSRVVRFNRPAVEDIHTDYVSSLSLETWCDADGLFAHAEMSKYLLTVTNDPAPGAFYNSFLIAQQRLALLEGQELVRLSLLVGLTLYSDRVCRVVTQRQVAELTELLGRETLLSTHRELRFLKGKSSELIKKGSALWEVTQMLPPSDDEQYIEVLWDVVRAVGIGVVTFFLRMHTDDVLHRIAIKLPAFWSEGVGNNHDGPQADVAQRFAEMMRYAGRLELSEHQARLCWGMLSRIMKQEMNHIWQNLFA
ncbi:SctK family type III secretion system sorting platform protein [Halodesulfovibrio marinisediminis]|uniref:YOP protein translocation protein K (YscK) n=1 Tax=Halodesulfovibrio marinisediminis DSM 17456 TaxID=1121457 RepID=A0A1N6I944_9BACT|nr:SctK family type III secretion system sorting platform protein [Halodesulfovibrio marinisediminis]SIO28485.1 YOP protein translocation protein K (YscK) [Halodesulfovibrio marinisediminis DSM 17456]